MITRDLAQTYIVPMFVHNSKIGTCDSPFTCTCAAGVAGAGSTYFPGFVVDRLGLPKNFTAVALAPMIYAEQNSSDENSKLRYQGISLGLQHTSASGGAWSDYSTGDWLGGTAVGAGLWRNTTVSSTVDMAVIDNYAYQLDIGVAGTLGGILATASSTSAGLSVSAGATSTGQAYYAGPPAVFDLTGAKRFVRALVRPVLGTTACGNLGAWVSGVYVFDQPDVAPGSLLSTDNQLRRILVTTPCAT